MNIVIVFAIPCYMATVARSAPLPDKSALVEDPQFQEILQRSRSVTQKILFSITDTHRACIYTKGLLLNSSDNSKLDLIASKIGLPPAPELKAVSKGFVLENCLTQMSEGLQLHRALMNAVSPQLVQKVEVTDLMNDIRDLSIHISKMLKIVQTELVVPSPTPVALHLTGEYEVQVAAHLILVHLQDFGQGMMRCFKSLDPSNEEELDS